MPVATTIIRLKLNSAEKSEPTGKENWKNIESCNKENDMYLNDESSSPSQWDCQPCMSRSVVVFVM